MPALLTPGDVVDDSLTVRDDRGRRWMARKPNGACAALAGRSCTIYETRPQVCRKFQIAGALCEAARGAVLAKEATA